MKEAYRGSAKTRQASASTSTQAAGCGLRLGGLVPSGWSRAFGLVVGVGLAGGSAQFDQLGECLVCFGSVAVAYGCVHVSSGGVEVDGGEPQPALGRALNAA
jgi:hypothetical protein